MTAPTPMTDAEQTQFAAFMCERLPREKGEKYHRLYLFTEYAKRVLKLPQLLHWRGLSKDQASAVMKAAVGEYPK